MQFGEMRFVQCDLVSERMTSVQFGEMQFVQCDQVTEHMTLDQPYELCVDLVDSLVYDLDLAAELDFLGCNHDLEAANSVGNFDLGDAYDPETAFSLVTDHLDSNFVDNHFAWLYLQQETVWKRNQSTGQTGWEIPALHSSFPQTVSAFVHLMFYNNKKGSET